MKLFFIYLSFSLSLIITLFTPEYSASSEKKVTMTSWFREPNIFEVAKNAAESKVRPYRILLVGGSLEETWSLWSALSEYKIDPSQIQLDVINIDAREIRRFNTRNYHLPLDPIRQKALESGFFVLTSSPKYEYQDEEPSTYPHARATLSTIVRKQTKLIKVDILKQDLFQNEAPYNQIVINNVLMHYDHSERRRIIQNLTSALHHNGILHFERAATFFSSPWRSLYEDWWSHSKNWYDLGLEPSSKDTIMRLYEDYKDKQNDFVFLSPPKSFKKRESQIVVDCEYSLSY
ncbi:MAG: hypothetical protein H6625_06695 [Bdellovibrionaceae bacterium]|nr:hypothetical protein [Pseudobdellovibrionaceae bacterium]